MPWAWRLNCLFSCGMRYKLPTAKRRIPHIKNKAEKGVEMEFLKEVLGESYDSFEVAVKAYNEANKDKGIKLADLSRGEYVHRDKFADAETKLKGYEKQIAELKGNADFKKQYEQMKNQYDREVQELKGTLEKERFSGALEKELTAARARNVKALSALLDMEAIGYEDGKITGLEAQIEQIKKENGFLFDDAPRDTGMKMGTSPRAKDDFIDHARKAAGLNN